MQTGLCPQHCNTATQWSETDQSNLVLQSKVETISKPFVWLTPNFREATLTHKTTTCIFFFNNESRDIDKPYVIHKSSKDNGKNGLQWVCSQKIPLLYQEGIYIGYTCCPILLSLFNRIHVCLNLKNPLVTIAIFNNNLTGITSLSYPK